MPDTTPYAIRLIHVTQRYRVIQERPDTVRELFSTFFRHSSTIHDFEAVKDVTVDIPEGQVVGLVGHNGSGKSTLLKIIAGVFKPSKGTVQVSGRVAPLIELGAGFHPELTGRENILLSGLLMGHSKAEMKERENKIIEFAEIGEFIDAPVKQYSSGMYMRLAFSVATEINPEILVIDEILSVGDAAFQEKSLERIENFRRSGATILLVSHQLNLVARHCNRALLLDHGQLVADGDPKDVLAIYRGDVDPESYLVV